MNARTQAMPIAANVTLAMTSRVHCFFSCLRVFVILIFLPKAED